MRDSTAASSEARLERSTRLAGVGMRIEAAHGRCARETTASRARMVAALRSAASALRSALKRVVPTISRAMRIISASMSTAGTVRQRSQAASTAVTTAPRICATSSWWKAGCTVRRADRQTSPSAVRRPSPVSTDKPRYCMVCLS